MARIRSIKPEFWTSAQVMECSTNARLLFIGLWNFADDAGRHPNSPKQIKAEVFPGDDLSTAEIARMIDELSTNGLLLPYDADGQRYLQITGWHHQKIDRPQRPRYPEPSSNDRRTFVPDTIRKDTIGYDRKDQKGACAPNGASRFAFEGKVIKLTHADYAAWSEANPHIEFRSYLIARDAYLAEQPATERKRWFVSTPADLRNKNLEAKRKAQPPPREEKFGGLVITELGEKHG